MTSVVKLTWSQSYKRDVVLKKNWRNCYMCPLFYFWILGQKDANNQNLASQEIKSKFYCLNNHQIKYQKTDNKEFMITVHVFYLFWQSLIELWTWQTVTLVEAQVIPNAYDMAGLPHVWGCHCGPDKDYNWNPKSPNLDVEVCN